MVVDEEPRRGPRISRRRLVVVLVMLGLGVAVGGVFAWTSGDDEPVQAGDAGGAHSPTSPATPVSPVSSLPPSVAASAGGGSPAPSPASKSSQPAVQPPSVKWSGSSAGRLPVSSSDGPKVMTDKESSGFSRTPEGALLAAVHISRRASDPDLDVSAGVIKRQFLPGPDRDLMVKVYANRAAETNPDASPSPVVGYWYESYRESEAVIHLVVQTNTVSSGGVVAVTHTVRWKGGDWKMVAPPGGLWSSVSRSAESLPSFTSWVER